jgi:YidC/Oxa1 family membrane protein insertase
MLIWSSGLDLLRVLLFALTHVCGGSLGAGIVVLSLLVRVALLPYTLRLATRAREHEAARQRLAPKTAAMRKRYANDPIRLAGETRALYAANGIGLNPKGAWLGTVVQGVIGGAVYRVVSTSARRAVGFLWIGDLTRPDVLVASIAAGLAGAAVMTSGSATGGSPKTAAAIAAGFTFLLAWRLSASVGLYWLSSNVIGVVQSLLLRRRAARTPAA